MKLNIKGPNYFNVFDSRIIVLYASYKDFLI